MTPDQYRAEGLRTEPDPIPVFIRTGISDAHDRVMSRIVHALFGKMTELGELVDPIKKHLIYGKPIDLVNLIEEVGDDTWYTNLILDALGSTWDEAWTKNIAKLRARFPGKFTQEQALNRDLDAERAALEG